MAKLDGTNSAQRAWWNERAASIDDNFVSKLQEAEAQPGANLQDLFDQHLSEMDALKVAMPRADDFRLPHIKQLVKTPKTNPVHEATVASPPLQAPESRELPTFVPESLERRQKRRRGRFLGSSRDPGAMTTPLIPDLKPPGAWPDELEDEDSSADEDEEEEELPPARSRRGARGGTRGARGARRARGRCSGSRRASSREEAEPAPWAEALPAPEPMEPVRSCELADLWSAYGASWVEYNQCVVPSVFPQMGDVATGATLEAYRYTRTSASLFDVSFKTCLRITGADREFVADQFLTCSLRAMRAGDVQYACILDSKGLVLDDAFVFLEETAINILSSGWHAKQLFEYLGQLLSWH